jgi:serine/threonine protein kinase
MMACEQVVRRSYPHLALLERIHKQSGLRKHGEISFALRARSIIRQTMSLEPRTKLGPYEILSTLGAGGMGEVYRARDSRLDRTVAIKVMRPGVAADEYHRKRFLREARATAALSNPGIAVLYDAGEAGECLYLAMEYVEGHTLFADVVDSADMGMVQGRCCLGLATKTFQRLMILGNILRQELQSDKALESRILSFVDHAGTDPPAADLVTRLPD